MSFSEHSSEAKSLALAEHGGVYSTEWNGTEWKGMEWNDGLNRGTERFLYLKLAGYHCLLVPTQVISSPSSE